MTQRITTPAPSTRLLTVISRCLFVIASAALLWFIVTFLYWPNAVALKSVFLPDSGSVWESIQTLAASDRVVAALRNTLVVSLISVITVNIVGTLQVFLLEALDLRGLRFLTIAYALPLVFSSVSAITGYAMVYGSNGILTRALQTVFPALPDTWFTGMPAIILVHTFTMTGYHFLFMRPALRRVDFSMVEAARSLGMGVVPALLRVVMPIMRPMVLASVLMVFISSIGSFAAPNILGGTHFPMAAPLVMALSGLGRQDLAALLGLGLGLVAVILLLWALRAERRSQLFSSNKSHKPFERITLRKPAVRVAAYLVAYALAAINIVPLAATVLLSFSPLEAIRRGELSWTFTFEHYLDVFGTPSVLEPLKNSLVLCLIAIPIALVIGVFASYLIHRRRNKLTDILQISVFLPHFLPGILIAVGFMLAFGSPSALVAGQVLIGSYWILPLAYVVVLIPLTVRLTSAAFAGLDPALDDAARSLGAGPERRFFRVTLPILAPVLMQVAALGFNGTFDEYTLSVMLYNLNNKPLGVTLGALAATQDLDMVGITAAYVVLNTFISLAVVLFADRMAARASRRALGSATGGAR